MAIPFGGCRAGRHVRRRRRAARPLEAASIALASTGATSDDAALLSLAEHAERSDVTASVLDTIDLTVDEFARAYARIAPADLLTDVQALSRQVGALLAGRATPAQRRRLMVAGGWLALLAATLHVDLGHRRHAGAARAVASTLDREAEHGEIGAWAVEIDTWAALVDQDWRRAAALAEAGQAVAPAGSSAAVQLTAPAPPHDLATASPSAPRWTTPGGSSTASPATAPGTATSRSTTGSCRAARRPHCPGSVTRRASGRPAPWSTRTPRSARPAASRPPAWTSG